MVSRTINANFSRNIGLVTPEQQAALSAAHITITGVGGMGGVAAEALVRMGVGAVTVLDHDRYEASNINRQLHCTQSTMGQYKVEAVANKLRDINPALKIKTYKGLDPSNVEAVVGPADLVINGMDDLKASILLERCARRLGKTIVDAWITPYASVFVMQPGQAHWEEFLGFPTHGKALEDITPADVQESLRREVAFTLSQFHPFDIIKPELVEAILNGTHPRPSFVPVVWLSGTLMANEAMKILTSQGRIASPYGVFYNQYDHEIRHVTLSECPITSEESDHARTSRHQKLAG